MNLLVTTTASGVGTAGIISDSLTKGNNTCYNRVPNISTCTQTYRDDMTSTYINIHSHTLGTRSSTMSAGRE